MREQKIQETVFVDGQPLRFIRCDKDGNEIPPEKLSEMNFTNATIQKIVTETAGRLSNEAPTPNPFEAGFTTM